MDFPSLKGFGSLALTAVGTWGVLSVACSDDGPTYVIYTGGAAGADASGGSNPGSGGNGNGGSNPGSGGSDPGSGGSDPGSGGSDPGSGGSNPGSGGSDPGSGGSNPGSGGAPPGGNGNVSGSNGAGGTTPNTPITLIDDFADCEGNIIEIDGRKGAWYSLNALNTITFGPPPDIGWADQSCGAFIVGQCANCEVAGIAVILAAGSYNLSGYQGIDITFESEASLYIAVKNTNGQAYGYSRSGAIAGTGTGGTRRVYFNTLTADAQFSVNNGLASAQEIHFTLDDYSKAYGFGLGIHRLELF